MPVLVCKFAREERGKILQKTIQSRRRRVNETEEGYRQKERRGAGRGAKESKIMDRYTETKSETGTLTDRETERQGRTRGWEVIEVEGQTEQRQRKRMRRRRRRLREGARQRGSEGESWSGATDRKVRCQKKGRE